MARAKTEPKIPIVDVEWEDAFGNGGYIEPEEIEEISPFVVRSVGLLVKETKTHVCIAQDKMADGSRYRTPLYVPKKYILKIKKL